MLAWARDTAASQGNLSLARPSFICLSPTPFPSLPSPHEFPSVERRHHWHRTLAAPHQRRPSTTEYSTGRPPRRGRHNPRSLLRQPLPPLPRCGLMMAASSSPPQPPAPDLDLPDMDVDVVSFPASTPKSHLFLLQLYLLDRHNYRFNFYYIRETC